MDPWGKFKGNAETSSLAGRVDIRARHTMVNIPWLAAYLLLVTVEGKAIMNRDPARRAHELLQLIASLPSSEPSTHSLLATQPPGRGGAGLLLRSRLAGKRNIRGAQREWKHRWCEVGART